MKKVLKCLAAVVLFLVLLLIIYVIYVFAAYERLPDKLPLEIGRVEAGTSDGSSAAEDNTESQDDVMS